MNDRLASPTPEILELWEQGGAVLRERSSPPPRNCWDGGRWERKKSPRDYAPPLILD